MILNRNKLKVITTLVDLVFPPRCVICDDILFFSDKKHGICRKCIHKASIIKGRRCYKCGKKISSETKEYCYDCERRKHYFDRGFSLFQYNDQIRPSLYRLKYGGRYEYGEYYGALMARIYKDSIIRAKVDAIVPVPLHKNRIYERGYNQAEAIARALSERTGIPCYEKYVVRQKNTVPLKLMTPSERQKNLKNAFIIGQNDVKSKITIVIDDIYTTGSTIDAIAKVLKASGVRKVYFLTVASGEDGGM